MNGREREYINKQRRKNIQSALWLQCNTLTQNNNNNTNRPGMYASGRNPHFSSESESISVGETGGGVVEAASTIYRTDNLLVIYNFFFNSFGRRVKCSDDL